MDLRQQIESYYFEHFGELAPDKQFHYASRLASWRKNPRAYKAIADLEDYMTNGGNIDSALKDVLASRIKNIYAKQERQVYFDKYKSLFGLHNAFFRIRHLKEFYGLDARDVLLKLVDYQELENLYNDLAGDQAALRILSRFAVDYLYLFEQLFDHPRLDPGLIYSQKEHYDLTDPVQRHLFIYLFTHAIIADSNFYQRLIPPDQVALYTDMLKELENLFQDGSDYKMDTKFEFLVACRLCGYGSSLFGSFEAQAAASLDPSSSYIIEPSADSPNEGINDFNRSEHRNVLFVMSGSAYDPERPS